MKHNWDYKRLGDVCEAISGLWTGKNPPFVNVGVIRNTNFTKHCTLNPDNIFYTDVEVKAFNKRKLQKGDIIIEKSGGSEKNPVGRPILFLLDGDFSFSNFTATLRLIDKSISPTFLHKALISLYFNGATRKLQSRTTGLFNLNWKGYLNLQIPVPPMEMQERIVAELDRINETIDDCRELLRILDALAQSLFYDFFGDIYTNPKGWITCKLGDVSEKISNGANTKIEIDTYKTEGIMFFRCQNVWKNRFDLSDIVYVDDETNSKMKGSILKHNDLLVTKIGRLFTENSSLGRVALYEGEDDKANLSGNLSYIRLRPTVAPKFILYILISDYFRDYVRNTTSGGIDKRALNNSQLKDLPIYLPPLALQEQFAERIEQIEAQKKGVEQTIAELQTLLDSRMDYWFN